MIQQKFLIIGAGVAGISLAKHLLNERQQVTLVDSGINRSSAVAAGVINPIVFRRMTKSWRADEFIPFAENFYRSFGKECTSQFFIPITIRRLFSSQIERSLWLEKQSLEGFKKYLSPITPEDDRFNGSINEHGSGRVINSSYISTEVFLEKSKSWIKENANFIQEEFDYSSIDPVKLLYKQEEYAGIIFCEGVEVIHNPWFKHIPVNPTQGETLTITSENISTTELLNRKCFLLPIGRQTFKVGSTYKWDTYTSEITEAGKEEILQNLAVLTNEPYTVINQQAGIRPTTLDRRPIMGTHPTFSGLHIFNGLGAKGYLLAPLLSKEMTDYLLNGKVLDREVSLSRISK